jgi:hypothetical protein
MPTLASTAKSLAASVRAGFACGMLNAAAVAVEKP